MLRMSKERQTLTDAPHKRIRETSGPIQGWP